MHDTWRYMAAALALPFIASRPPSAAKPLPWRGDVQDPYGGLHWVTKRALFQALPAAMKAAMLAFLAFAALAARAQPPGANQGLPPSAKATGLAPQQVQVLAVEQIQSQYNWSSTDTLTFLGGRWEPWAGAAPKRCLRPEDGTAPGASATASGRIVCYVHRRPHTSLLTGCPLSCLQRAQSTPNAWRPSLTGTVDSFSHWCTCTMVMLSLAQHSG